MGDVIKFVPRAPKELDAAARAVLQKISDLMEREAKRRRLIYGEAESQELERIFALYPMFRLTHSNRARRCLYCDYLIDPMELHFVHSGSYICAQGSCMDRSS